MSAVLRLEKRGGVVAASGPRSARFGYRLGAEDGVWARWDWKDGRLEARCDRLGFYPLFYHQDARRLAIADSIDGLLGAGAPASLDDDALAVFLRLGFFLGEDTPFAAIRALPPGALLRWQDGRFSLESAPPALETDGRSWSRAEAVRRYGEVFHEAVLSFPKVEGAALPLSGGRDSRHILLALKALGRPPRACLTVAPLPPRSREDADLAASVAAAVGVPHRSVPAVRRLLDAERRKNSLTSYCADEHAWLLPLRFELGAGRFPAVFDGIGGDVLSAGLYLTEERHALMKSGRLAELAEDLLEPEGQLPRMLAAEALRRWSRAAAVERLRAELALHRDAANPVGQFFFWNRTRREIALSPWALLNEGRQVYAPYLAEPVRSFLAGLPARLLLDHRFHDEAIAAEYPQFAVVPFERGRLERGPGARLLYARYGSEFAARCLASREGRELLNPSFYAPRVAKGLVSADYGTSFLFMFNKAVYLTQLVARARARRPEDASA